MVFTCMWQTYVSHAKQGKICHAWRNACSHAFPIKTQGMSRTTHPDSNQVESPTQRAAGSSLDWFMKRFKLILWNLLKMLLFQCVIIEQQEITKQGTDSCFSLFYCFSLPRIPSHPFLTNLAEDQGAGSQTVQTLWAPVTYEERVRTTGDTEDQRRHCTLSHYSSIYLTCKWCVGESAG